MDKLKGRGHEDRSDSDERKGKKAERQERVGNVRNRRQEEQQEGRSERSQNEGHACHEVYGPACQGSDRVSRGLKGIKSHPQEGGHVKALVVNPVTLNPLHHLEQLRVLKIQPAGSQCLGQSVNQSVAQSASQSIGKRESANQSMDKRVS